MRSSLDDVIEGLGISQFTTPASLRAWSLSCRFVSATMLGELLLLIPLGLM